MNEAAPASTPTASWLRRRWRWLVLALIAIVAVLGVVAALSWHFSSAVLVPDHSDWPANVTVNDVSRERIVLSRSEDALRPGVYGLDWQGGQAIVGDVVASNADQVTRQLRAVHGYLASGMTVAVDPQVYTGSPRMALGMGSTTVDVPGELGPMVAWRTAGRSDTWAIVVHGINSTPETGLRVVPVLHRDGLTSLLIGYREDLGAPPSPDGLHHMGLTEWRDLAAAARYALDHGARRLVLIGYSMGGAIVAQFMERSPLAPRVVGLVLDAPVLDWKSTIAFNATQMGLPSFTATPVDWMIGARIDADWGSLDAAQHPEDFHLPILLFHGTEDKVVPIADSDSFAAELPGWVVYHRVSKAGHTESWNVDPKLYEARLTAFLARIGAAASGKHLPAPKGRRG